MICKGLLNLKWDLRWCESVHGKSYNVLIGNKKYTIHFPNTPDDWKVDNAAVDHLHRNLTAPNILKGWERKTKPLIFGNPTCYPYLDSVINILGISFECENDNYKERSLELYSNIDKWINNLYKILKIMTNAWDYDSDLTQPGASLELYTVIDNKIRKINNDKETIISVSVHEHKDSIKESQLKKAIVLLNDNNFQLPISYDYYLEAVKAYEKENYRQCILDCATGVEICITNTVIEKFKQKGIMISNNKLNNFKGLEKRKNLLKLVEEIPEFDFGLITSPRNRAIHKGEIISEKEALDCMRETKKILDLFEKFY